MLWLFQDDLDSQATTEKKDGIKKKKQLVKTMELPIEAYTHGYSQAELNNFMEQEVSLSGQVFIMILVVKHLEGFSLLGTSFCHIGPVLVLVYHRDL
jgi:hypothetical protein